MKEYNVLVFRQRLREAMRSAGINYVQMGDLLDRDPKNLREIAYRAPKQGPTAQTLMELSQALGCSIDYLLGVES